MIMYDISLSLFEFCVSGIFPETAWRVMNCRQATHLFLHDSGFRRLKTINLNIRFRS